MSRTENSRLKKLCVTLSFLLLVGCGDDDAESELVEVTPVVVKTGFFKDSFVAGIQYSTESRSGLTSSSGAFNYIEGEMITFSIGDIVFPSALAAFNLTPFDLIENSDESNIRVTNISRLLQTLDADNELSNGIQINQEAIDGAHGITLDFSDVDFGVAGSASQNYIDSLNRDIDGVAISMVSSESAMTHLLETVSNLQQKLFTSDFIVGNTFSVNNDGSNFSELYFKEDLTGTLKTSDSVVYPLTWEINTKGELILSVQESAITTVWEFTDADTEDGVANYTFDQRDAIFNGGLGQMTRIDHAFLASFLEGHIFIIDHDDSSVSQISFLSGGLGSIDYLGSDSITISWSISLGVLTIEETGNSKITWVFTATSVSDTSIAYSYSKAKDGVITRSDEGPYTLSLE